MRKATILDLPSCGREEFQHLIGHPSLDVRRSRPLACKSSEIIILGGSQRTIADLDYLRRNGGDRLLRSHLAKGGSILAVCGGYQMLGRWLYDPWMKQGDKPIAEGFGFLPHSTFFGAKMLNVKTTATLLVGAGAGGEITGEEHRSGFSWTPDGACGFAPMLAIRSRTPFEGKASAAPTPENCRLVPGSEPFDGMVTNDRQIWATYVHCICANPAFQRSFLTCHL